MLYAFRSLRAGLGNSRRKNLVSHNLKTIKTKRKTKLLIKISRFSERRKKTRKKTNTRKSEF